MASTAADPGTSPSISQSTSVVSPSRAVDDDMSVGVAVDVGDAGTVGGDFAFPRTTGPKPRGTDVANRYLDRLVRTAHSDPALREALYHFFNLERPPLSLFRPGILWGC